MNRLNEYCRGLRQGRFLAAGLALAVVAAIQWGCGKPQPVEAGTAGSGGGLTTVGVSKASRKTLDRQLTVSSELVPFQEIDVYAKESGFVRDLNVDYGSRVAKGQVMAVLEIPELEAQLRQDDAMVGSASEQVTHAQHEVNRYDAQRHVLQLQYARLDGVAKKQPGLVAQQEVDDAQGKDLAGEAALEASKSNLQSMQSQLLAAKAKMEHDRVLLDYAKITAPFAGVVTQRYANLGTLMQGGTNSSTQAMPLVRLSQDDKFRLVIPVPESYVRYIHVGDSVSVSVPSLNRVFPGKVARFSVDVTKDTRTMHTEVDVTNPNHLLIPGLYADATLTLEHKAGALSVPLQAVSHENGQTSVFVVDSSNKLVKRNVVLALQTADEAEVLSGVAEGDLVVVSDPSGLKPGEIVHPQVANVTPYQDEKEQ